MNPSSGDEVKYYICSNGVKFWHTICMSILKRGKRVVFNFGKFIIFLSSDLANFSFAVFEIRSFRSSMFATRLRQYSSYTVASAVVFFVNMVTL